MADVNPEIETLRDCATRPDGGKRCGAEPPAACHCDCPQPCAECAAVNEPETDT